MSIQCDQTFSMGILTIGRETTKNDFGPSEIRRYETRILIFGNFGRLLFGRADICIYCNNATFGTGLKNVMLFHGRSTLE